MSPVLICIISVLEQFIESLVSSFLICLYMINVTCLWSVLFASNLNKRPMMAIIIVLPLRNLQF